MPVTFGWSAETIITGGVGAKYLATGHIVYARGDALLAVPFDVNRLEVSGQPVPMVEGVVHASDYGRVSRRQRHWHAGVSAGR